ncbi:MAG: glutaminyl-tRNA synthetase [Chlamydiales bacterium]
MTSSNTTESKPTDFIRNIINEDLRTNKHGGKVVTRFPPEPNGYLHIGHAKSICLNFGLAKEYNGACHLRFDDTDPVKEDTVYVESIKDAVQWLGFSWGEHLYHSSDYFEKLYELAIQLIKDGKAYVCSQSLEEIREYRGTVTEAGRNSPFRNRSVEENLDLFSRMRAREFKDGAHVLRAKIDMASANMKMRDPLLYRIRHTSHHITGDKWCIYPLYDYTHCLSDSFEGVTHSICTLEFENNRELYDWIINELDMPEKPKQYEFARLNVNYTIMSKRKILDLVEGNYVDGWDDPRILTIAGLRRRGYTPEAIRNFCASVGIAKANSVVDMAQLEYTIRDDLNFKAPRVLAVLKPLKVVITNFPENKSLELNAPYYPEDVPKEGSRNLPFGREIYIEEEDFAENPPKGFFRLSPGKEVRLRYSYVIRCDEAIKDENGQTIELRCTYDEDTPVGENPSDGRRIKGTIQWVSAVHAIPAEVRLYDRLFTVENPGVGEHEDFLSYLNPHSLETYPNALIEPSVKGTPKETHFQFERHGFFVTDLKDSSPEKLVFNRIVPLKDSWGKKAIPKKDEEIKSPPPKKQNVKTVEKANAVERPDVKLSEKQEAISLRYQDELNLPKDYAVLLAQDKLLSGYFDSAVESYNNPKGIANWLINELLRELKDHTEDTPPVTPENLAQLVKCIDEKTISTKIAKDVFNEMISSKKSPKSIIEEKGLKQISGVEELEPIIDTLIAENPDVVEQIRAGRSNRIGFFVGQVMKVTGGKANPQLVNQLLAKKLN